MADIEMKQETTKVKPFLKKTTRVMEGIEFTSNGKRILYFDEKERIKEEIQNTSNQVFKFSFYDNEKLIESINNIDITNLEFYLLENNDNNPNMRTAYIQDTENKNLFVPKNLYNRYMYDKKIAALITMLSAKGDGTITIKLVDCCKYLPDFTSMSQIQDRTISFSKTQTNTYNEHTLTNDLKEINTLLSKGVKELKNYPIKVDYLQKVNLDDKCINSVVMDVASIDVILN